MLVILKSAMTKLSPSEKGFGVVSFILIVALVIAVLNAYAYFNPNFSLARYSPLNYFRIKQDDIRVRDLSTIQKAIEQYYDANNQVPTNDGWCGRVSGVLHPELREALVAYLGRDGLPSDPLRGSTEKDYFYYRVDRTHYVLMADLEIPRNQGLAPEKYNFTGCHDWPGDGVYNYRIGNID
ncbi:MAG TPA: hypothetical protein VLE47_04640 [Candidatus Saccharimonadales bacterium]|nr:hypothetical protein [Candidatus Saccharimonadales bacterium]